MTKKKTSLLGKTYDAEYIDADGSTTTFTFKKATCQQFLDWDDIRQDIGNGKEIEMPPEEEGGETQMIPADYSKAEIIRMLMGAITPQLVQAVHRPKPKSPAKQISLTSLEYPVLVDAFGLMNRGADCSYEVKKPSGSPSPAAGAPSTQTTSRTR